MAYYQTAPRQHYQTGHAFEDAVNPSYPDLPSELRTTPRPASAQSRPRTVYDSTSNSGSYQSTAITRSMSNPIARSSQSGRSEASVSTENLPPIPRAARTVNECLLHDARYPELDNIVSQGQSAEYDMPKSHAWMPFTRTQLYPIPDAIFDQYNQAQCHTMMGLFAEIGQAWMTVDNRLYMWDFASGMAFQGYEDQLNTITAVRLLKPRPGVFIDAINYALVIATTIEIILIGIEATPNAPGGPKYDVQMVDTKMSVSVKGLDVSVIEGSAKTGRVFFGGRSDNDVYELTYQGDEGWFSTRCGKINQTSQGISSFAPKISIPFLGKQADQEFIRKMIIDDSRNLLYTLSSTSTIRAFYISSDHRLIPRITHTFPQTLANIRVMMQSSSLLSQTSSIIDISPVPAQQARRTHLIAITSTGCRLYMSAVSSDFTYESAPSSMQVIHVRFPPPNTNGPPIQQRDGAIHQSPVLTPSRKAKVFPPGYFFCFVNKPDQGDSLFIAAPDSARIALLAEMGHGRLQLYETGFWIALESRAEAVELLSSPFAATNSPVGFGNEAAVQFDAPLTEVAVLTNTGIHVMRKRRLVEIFAAAIRYGGSSSAHGVEGEVRRFFELYGRSEGCATALAVTCGASTEVTFEQRTGKMADVEVKDLARKYFIEFGGKPRAESSYDSSALPSLDTVKLSGRHDGIALYTSRIVRSIWRSQIISELRSPMGITFQSTAPKAKLQSIQEQLVRLQQFLNDNKSFIDGLSGAESLMRVGSKVEEVAQQAEHRALHALVKLIDAMIEGISFVLVLFEDKLDEIVLSLSENQQQEVKRISYEGLFTTDAGNALAKDLVTAIVNKHIAAGEDVDTIAESLRRRCGSFCSADDVIIFKAVELLRKASSESDPEAKQKMLWESLRLFEQTASSLTMENLADTVKEFRDLHFFPGAVELPLVVAKEKDRGNQALTYIGDGTPENDPRKDYYLKRLDCYKMVFEALEAVENYSRSQPEVVDGQPSEAIKLYHETWNLVYHSDDEVFHYALYDWLFKRNQSIQLLEINSSYVLPYLIRMATNSLDHAQLLWQYHARRGNFSEAAEVLYRLARGDFELGLEQRLEFLSRARSFCSSYGPLASRQKMNDLAHTIQEELDVAIIQDDILRRAKEDNRISESKKVSLTKQLNSKLLSLSDLFNKFADPYGYYDVCLAIFQSADYRGPTEIKKCWGQLILQVHETAVREGEVQPFEAIADTVRRLGHRFNLSEYIFPPNELVPLLETYALEKQRDIGPSTWVVDTLLEAGIQPEVILRILDDMFWRNEIPFQGNSRRRLVRDAIHVTEKWFQASLRGARSTGGGLNRGGFKPDIVIEMLTQYQRSGVVDPAGREKLDRLVNEIRRRTGAGGV